ncbi:DUF6894 family protein [Sphingomonas sp.]|uniref:DUF6894 family protein n=1 Tax=Sphingomonas sp. TaxID=28214 RepID=UPI003B009398
MPRYFFHSADGERSYDEEGVELADDEAARNAAVGYAGEVLRYGGSELWDHGQWRVEVTDQEHQLLFTVITLAVDAPARPRRSST